MAYVTGSTEHAKHVLRSIGDAIRESRDMRSLVAAVTELIGRSYRERPTSAMTANAFRELLLRLDSMLSKGYGPEYVRRELLGLVEEKVDSIERGSREAAVVASRRIPDAASLLTHSYSYTVIAAIEEAANAGKSLKVYVTESRPGGEGLRMAEELSKRGVETVLIVDSAVRHVMGDVDLVLMGAEAIAADGSVLSKVGSGLVALAAREARVAVLVAASSYKLSPETVFGRSVEVPEAESVTSEGERPAYGVEAPLMDLVPHGYVDAIATERGILSPAAVPLLVREVYGAWPPKIADLEGLIAKVSAKVEE